MNKGETTRLAILELACSTASKIGLEGLSIGGLAKELEMSKSGIFAHFKSKEALQIQVLEYDSERFIKEFIHPALKTQRGEKRIIALFEYWMAWFDKRDENGCFFIAAIAEFDDRDGEVRDTLARQQQDWIDFIGNVVQTGVESGYLRSTLDPKQFAFELYGIVLSLHLSLRLLNDTNASARAKRAFENLLNNNQQ